MIVENLKLLLFIWWYCFLSQRQWHVTADQQTKCYVLYETKELLIITKMYIIIINILMLIASYAIVIIIIFVIIIITITVITISIMTVFIKSSWRIF